MLKIIVFFVCLYYQALSQPVTDGPPRCVREADCCPCPGARDQPSLADSSLLASADLDDCPCRPRGADSEGASSFLFPSALRPDGLHVRQNDAKEDVKNLLGPEVTLAASMLDTLREATEEEYRDALEREAARNAAETDAVPEESARNVVIIVNPRESDTNEDFVSEASHVQESRCIHPSGSTLIGRMRSSTNSFNTEDFLIPKLTRTELPRNNLLHLDSNTMASDVKPSVINENSNSRSAVSEVSALGHADPLKGLRRNENSLLSLLPKLKPSTKLITENIRSDQKNTKYQPESTNDENKQSFINSKLPLNLRNILKLRDVELIPKTIRNKSLAKPKFDLSHFAIPTLFSKKNTVSNGNCNDMLKTDTKNSLQPPIKNTEEKEMDADGSENILNIEDMNSNTRFDSMPQPNKLLNNIDITIPRQIISNEDKNVNFESKQVNLESILDQSEDFSLVNEDGPEKETEITEDSRSMPNCDINRSQETDLNVSEPEDKELFTEEINKTNDNSYLFQDGNINSEQDSETDSSNSFIKTLKIPETDIPVTKKISDSLESIASPEKFTHNENFREGNVETPKSSAKRLENKNSASTLSKTLSNLRENVVKQLENFKHPLTISESLKVTDSKGNIITEKEQQRSISENNFNPTLTNNDNNKMESQLMVANFTNDKETLNDISMIDLQNMSDKLLDHNLEEQKEGRQILRNGINSINSKSDPLKENNEYDSKSSESNLNFINEAKTSDYVRDVACPTDLLNKNNKKVQENVPKSADEKTDQTEMDTGASDTVINTLPSLLDPLNPNLKLRSPLLNDITFPTPSDPLNLLGNPLGEVLNINTNLPTLDELGERLSNIFNTNDASSEDYSSLETNFSNDSPVEAMATDASTRNSMRNLPVLQQIENLSNDIISRRPKMPENLIKKQGLQLNSFRAHLPSPTTLDLTPLKSESKLLNRPEINKKSNIFNTENTISRKVKPIRLLSNSLDGISTLDDLRDALRSNSNNLLSNSDHPELNFLTENIRSHDINDVAKNIKLNAEKTFKGIQRKMKSTLKKPTLYKSFGDTFAKPQDLLDDMNDKLKGLHYDLNDRLSTIRENILESSRIKSLVEPPRNGNVMKNLRKTKPKSSHSNLRTAASTTTEQKIDPKTDNNQNDLAGIKLRNYINSDWNKPQRTQIAAESAPTLVRTEIPKSVDPPFSYSYRTPPPFQHPFRTEFLRERTPVPLLQRNGASPIPPFRPTVSPFNNQRQPKVTVSFGTTTPSPIITPSKPIIRVPNLSQSQLKNNKPMPSGAIDVASNENSAEDTKLSPVKFNPLRVSAALPSPLDEDYEDTLDNFSDENLPQQNIIFKTPVFRETAKHNTPQIQEKTNRMKLANTIDNKLQDIATKSSVKTSNWPRVKDKLLVSKIQQSGNNKLVSHNNNSQLANGARNEQIDMLRSPTENADISIVDEPLKENVSYRCRMVCTKEIR